MIDKNIKKQIIEYIKQGTTIGTVSRSLKIPKKDIRDYLTKLEKAGIDVNGSDIKDIDIDIDTTADTNSTVDTDRVDEINEKILELNQAGLRNVEIAEILNLSSSTISHRVKKMQEKGIAFSKKLGTEQRDEQILKLIKEGLTANEIAGELEISNSTVYKTIKMMKNSGIDVPYMPNHKYGKIDMQIQQMSEEGLYQNEIAKKIGLSPQAVSQRIQKMRKYGIAVIKDTKQEEENREKENNQILDLIAKGTPRKEIAKMLGLSVTSLRTRIKKMSNSGIEIPHVPIKKKKEVDEIDREILKLRQQGLTVLEIAFRLNFSSKTSVFKRLRKIKEIENSKKETTYDKTAKYINLSKAEIEKAILNLAKSKNATFEQMQRIAQDYDINLSRTLYSMDVEER